MQADGTAPSPGRGVSIAVIDSGVHADHPHVGGVAGGIAIGSAGEVTGDYVDRIGHGTAVMAVIKEKAPAARYYAVRVFDSRLTTTAATLASAIEWAIEQQVDIINLSLGTTNSAHAARLHDLVQRARALRIAIVSAWDAEGVWLPGSLPGVVTVEADWECPRDQFGVRRHGDVVVFRASGFARPIPGIDPRRNLNGVSFAVANVSGFLADALSRQPEGAADPIGLLIGAAEQGTAMVDARSA